MKITKKEILESLDTKYKEEDGVCYKQENGGDWVEISNEEYADNTHNEFVGSKGEIISGSNHVDQNDSATSSYHTTDVSAHQRMQPPSWLTSYGYTSYMDETRENKMTRVIEDIVSNREFSKEVIDKIKYDDGIPEIDALKEEFPVIVRKITHVKELIERENISGGEKAVFVSSFLSMDLSDVPSEYMEEIKNKLNNYG